MSSLWTPGGEHRVERAVPATEPGIPEPGQAGAGEDLDAETEARYRDDLRRLEAELLKVPAADVIANHCYSFFQLAALHLSQDPPHLEDAKAAVDAFGAVVESLGDRLGPPAATLRDGLAQIRLAYVEIAGGRAAADHDADPGG